MSATFFYKDEIVNIFGFAGHVVFVTTPHLCSVKSIIDNTNGHGSIPIKFIDKNRWWGPGGVDQWAGASSCVPEVTMSIPSQSMYRSNDQCLSPTSVFLSLSLLE